ncbi:LpqB family beta-propeller domain-containing protein [Isoptericola sp. BMS4]|uniref:LpqB family beta-propeller domain-containing protein n=1 Tax=Isoptericola sp. BMS4 TaxID=2527875 RepID=UPI00141F3A0D|nr:LpqB family beta-propeller domain-containing protein [Isoptericola sp. BMS4]
MSTRHRTRRARAPRTTVLTTALAALLVVLVGVVTSCARIPTEGPVRDGTAELEEAGEIGYIPSGPSPGASPDEIVQGFLNSASVGPTSATFVAAQEYLTERAWRGWDRYARVLVLDGPPQLDSGDVPEDATEATVTADASAVATLDEHGTYTEGATASPVETQFTLARNAAGEWRIAGLEDGLMLTTAFFSQAFHLTTLYFPTPDLTQWVPDVRWFPRQTWRTDATGEILAGPPEWLADSTTTVVPEGTTLALDAVTVSDDGTIDVSLTSTISQATADQRAMALAQLEATLVEGEGREVVLSDRTSPLAVPSETEVVGPRTEGDALVVADGRLRRVVGQEIEDLPDAPSLAGLDPTALAVGQGDDPVVVRDGSGRVVRVAADAAPQLLLAGEDLVAPSVDRFGSVWSARGSRLLVATAEGRTTRIDVDWLEPRTVLGLRVSPEGARVAVVTSGPGGRMVQVAGVQRDADNVPTGLSSPVRVGASVPQAELAVWQDEATLVLLGADVDADDGRSLYLSGVGGLLGSGGLSRELTGASDPRWATASVGAGTLLALSGDGTLSARQSSSLWPVVATDVDLVAFPG